MHGSIGPSAAAAVWEEGRPDGVDRDARDRSRCGSRSRKRSRSRSGTGARRPRRRIGLLRPQRRRRRAARRSARSPGPCQDGRCCSSGRARTSTPGSRTARRWWWRCRPSLDARRRSRRLAATTSWGTTHGSRAFPHGERTMLLAGLVPRSAGAAQPASRSSLPAGGPAPQRRPALRVPRRRIVKHFVETMPLRIVVAARARRVRERVRDRVVHGRAERRQPAATRSSSASRHLDDDRAPRGARRPRRSARAGAVAPTSFGRGTGIGFARYKNIAAYAAVVVELDRDDETAEIARRRAW